MNLRPKLYQIKIIRTGFLKGVALEIILREFFEKKKSLLSEIEDGQSSKERPNFHFDNHDCPADYKQKVESEAFLYIPGQFSLSLAFTCARKAGVCHHDNLCYQHSILSTKVLDMLYLTNKN